MNWLGVCIIIIYNNTIDNGSNKSFPVAIRHDFSTKILIEFENI